MHCRQEGRGKPDSVGASGLDILRTMVKVFEGDLTRPAENSVFKARIAMMRSTEGGDALGLAAIE